MEDDQFSASWQTPVKEIVKSAVVIDPAFGSEVTLVKVKKSRVLIMRLKFN
jgi:hypothetical protein